MNFDAKAHLGEMERSVSSLMKNGHPARAVALSRSYETTVADLWDAVTNGERIPRWFAPVSGDLKPGGRFQVENNAGGVITTCGRLSHFEITWEFGGDVSWVAVSLSDEGAGRVRLALTHTAHLSDHWTEYGPGAVGVGWEMGFLGLAFHLAQPTASRVDEVAFASSPDGKAFITGSSEAWGEAAVAAGTEPDVARAAAGRTTAFYTIGPA